VSQLPQVLKAPALPCLDSFYRAALNAGRSSQEKAACPSVCLSDKRADCDKMQETCVQIYIPYERSFSLVLAWWGVDLFYLQFGAKSPI